MHLCRSVNLLLSLLFSTILLSGCSSTYYGAMERIGMHKRDIMVDRVEKARDAQSDAQEQFKSALDEFNSVVKLEETDLKKAYDSLNDEYEDCVQASEDVSRRIDRVEDVADALFDEWEDELELYQNKQLQRDSRRKLQQTKRRYAEMLGNMHRAEQSMDPVLKIFRDNVLFLKHNLNAQAIGSLRGEFKNLQGEINILVQRMNRAIESSNEFIQDIQT